MSSTHYASGFCTSTPAATGIVILDPAFQEVLSIPCSFIPHTIVQNPVRPQQFVALAKMSEHACVVDLSVSATPTPISPAAGCQFYGHGQFSGDGEQFFTTESAPHRFGKLVVRRAKDLRILREIKLPNYGPHECVTVPGTGTVLVAMSGKSKDDPRNPTALPSQVLTVDTESGCIVRTQSLNESAEKFGHLALAESGELAATLTAHQGVPSGSALIAFANAGARLDPVPLPAGPDARFSHESLSIAFDDRKARAISTNPAGSTVSIWDARRGTFLAILPIPQPAGICVNVDGEYVATTALGSIYVIDPETLEARHVVHRPDLEFGSHLTTFNRAT